MELIDRYVKDVGRYLPIRDRDDIQRELRSLLEDQLRERVEGTPTEDDVVTLLKEYGPPINMAAKYGGEQGLIGPAMYPILITVTKVGLIVFAVLHLVALAVTLQGAGPADVLGIVMETVGKYMQSMLAFFGALVLILAGLERTGVRPDVTLETDWNPRSLPPTEQAIKLDRVGTAIGIGGGIIFLIILNYFREVGGITVGYIRTTGAGTVSHVTVLPVASGLFFVLSAIVFCEILVDVFVLQAGRWQVWSFMTRKALELGGFYYTYLILVAAMNAAQQMWPDLPAEVFQQIERWFPFIAVFIIIDGVVKLAKMIANLQGADFLRAREV